MNRRPIRWEVREPLGLLGAAKLFLAGVVVLGTVGAVVGAWRQAQAPDE